MTPRRTAALCLLLTASFFAISPADATSSNPGTIKVHDEASVEPESRNQPHVSCDFFIEGFNMADTSGTLVIQVWHPTADPAEVLNDTWTGTPETDGTGSHFLNGPYELPAGHYRVEAFSSTGHPGDNEHFAKAKMFWVDPCEGTPPTEDACPTDLVAVANGDGSITLTFTPSAGSNGTIVYRANGTGDLEYLVTLPPDATGYTDNTTVAGNAYSYSVTALFGDSETPQCPLVEVSSIPEFPTVLAMGLAGGGGLVAYAFMRRKK